MRRISISNSTRITVLNAVGLVACLALAAGVAGCRIHVDKTANGEDKNIQVDTPFGGIHVSTDQTTAADLGLPVYPGAEIVKDKDNDKSADIHMGFGEWQLRVKVVNYSSPDSQDKVVCFLQESAGPLRRRDYLPGQCARGQAHADLGGSDLRRHERRPCAGQR